MKPRGLFDEWNKWMPLVYSFSAARDRLLALEILKKLRTATANYGFWQE